MANFAADGKLCIQRDLVVNNLINQYEDISVQFDITETCKWISENHYEKVCLQFPDELLHISAKIYEEIKQKANVDLYILGDTSYASCCVDSVAAMHVQANAVVHYGRSCFSKTDIPTYTVLPKQLLDVAATLNITKVHFPSDGNVKLCFFYDAEFEHCKDEISKLFYQLYPRSYIAFVQEADTPNRFLGRVVYNKEGDQVPTVQLRECICIYLGTRGQTLFNYTVSVEASEWHLQEPQTGAVERQDQTSWFKRRRFLVEKCRDAASVGVLVCKLSGEQTRDVIARMKHLCRAHGKKSYIVSVGKPNVAKLANFPEIDVYVMIACPENDLYSSRDFYRPIVYPYELEVALNSNRAPYSTTHITDFDDLLPGRRHHCDIAEVKDGTDVSLVTGKIRETKIASHGGMSTDLVEKQNWALESIGTGLRDRSWAGLEQKLGESEVKNAEEGRKGIPLQYENEPEL